MDLTFAAILIMGGWVVAIIAAGLVMTLRPGGSSVRLSLASPLTIGVSGPREEILLGAEADVLGNPRGRVQAVRLRPNSRELQDLVIADGLLEGPHVPAGAILVADGRTIELADHWEEPAAHGSGAEGIILRGGMPVVSAEGKRLGKLRLVCFTQSSGTVTALVVEERGAVGTLRLLPIERVHEVGPSGVVTDVKRADWSGLQEFASDWDIRQAIQERLAADPALEGAQRSIIVSVQDQRVRLQGYAASHAQADRAFQMVKSVPGVVAVDQAIVTDDDLASRVNQAITQDPRTASARIGVTARFGVVDIIGEAPDLATARRIETVVRQVPGVQAVHNMTGVARRSAS